MPTSQFGKFRPPFPRALQNAPVTQNQGSRNFLDHGIGKRFENHFRAYARRIPHGDGDNRFTHDSVGKISRLDNAATIRAANVY